MTAVLESKALSQGHSQIPKNVTDYLLSAKDAARPALITQRESHTYGQLLSASNAVAHFLLGHGGQKGDRVFLLAENSFFWLAAYLGTMRAGLVAVPLPVALEPEAMRQIAEMTQPRFGFIQSKAVSTATQIPGMLVASDATDCSSSGIVDFKRMLEHFAESTDSNVRLPETASSDLAALMFTSGSTGKPRGVMVSHGNIISNTESIISSLHLRAQDRIMAVLPFHYCFGASLLHTHLCVGGSMVTDSRFMYPDKVLQRMVETECTGFAGVPSHFQILLRKSSLPRMKFPHLRYVQQAGGHMAPVFVRDLKAALPDTDIFLMYGQTEATARLTCLSPSDVASRPGSIGKAIRDVTIRVVNEAGIDAKPGEPGEIVAQGKNVTPGYWQDPEATAVTFRDGCLHTGDVGTLDDQGFLYLHDRTRDFIKCGGERVSCQAIEEHLLEFDGLLEAAVIGVPDEVLGEAIKAFVVPRDPGIPGFEEQLRQFSRHHIPLKWNPKVFVVLSALPKNNAGKVLKQALREN
jgi:acyl-CoA synthetase (AMP-forming)/AMP-acid ligase II